MRFDVFPTIFNSNELRSDRRSRSAMVQRAVEQKETLQKLWSNFAETLEQLYSNFPELYEYKIYEKCSKMRPWRGWGVPLKHQKVAFGTKVVAHGLQKVIWR